MMERKNGRFTREGVNASRDWSGAGPGAGSGPGKAEVSPGKAGVSPVEAGVSRRAEPEAIALSRILGNFRFPASKEEVTRKLAVEAFAHDGGRAADLHDLVVQLEPRDFRDLDDL